MSEVRRAAVVIGLVVITGAAVVIWLLRPGPTAGVRQSTKDAPDPFDARGRVSSAADRVLFNPTGTRVAVLGGRGLGIAENGEIRYLFERETNIVDAAWLPTTTRLLVAEGPGQTGRLSIVGVDGVAAGFVPLEPAVGFGTGHGMTVDESRRHAVVTAVERSPLGAERLHLVVVELSSGLTRPLTPPDGPDELRPAFAGPDTVIYTARTENDSWVAMRRLSGGEELRLSRTDERATSRGVIGTRLAVYTTSAGRVWTVPVTGGAATLLATVDAVDVLVAVDPTGTRLVVARETATGGTELATVPIRAPG